MLISKIMPKYDMIANVGKKCIEKCKNIIHRHNLRYKVKVSPKYGKLSTLPSFYPIKNFILKNDIMLSSLSTTQDLKYYGNTIIPNK